LSKFRRDAAGKQRAHTVDYFDKKARATWNGFAIDVPEFHGQLCIKNVDSQIT